MSIPERIIVGEKLYQITLADNSVMTVNASHVTTDEHGNLRLWQMWYPQGYDIRHDSRSDFIALWASGEWRSCRPIVIPTP